YLSLPPFLPPHKIKAARSPRGAPAFTRFEPCRFPSERVLMNLLIRPVQSSLGKKYVMALTGLALVSFVLAHLAGNLLVFLGPDAFNTYAAALKSKPLLLWTARIILLVIFLVHVYLGLVLTKQNTDARPIGYYYQNTIQASWASRH